MIDTDKYEGHTENKWEWYEFGDGDWILCPLFDGVKANEDGVWWVDENGIHIDSSHDIFNWDERILNLASDCQTGNRDPTRKEFNYCPHSIERLPHKKADMNLIQDAPLLLAEVMRLREENETLRKMDWEYECLWTWLAENTNLLNTIEPLMEEWKKEMIE